MANIFEEAKFGDKFLTRDGRIALYICEKDKLCLLVPENYNSFNAYHANGREIEDEEHDIDIISRYQEPIDDDKLDEIYEEYSSFYVHGRCVVESAWTIIEKNAFKAGYRKAIEE